MDDRDIQFFCQNIKLNAQGDSINFPGFDESYSACLHCKTNNPISRSSSSSKLASVEHI